MAFSVSATSRPLNHSYYSSSNTAKMVNKVNLSLLKSFFMFVKIFFHGILFPYFTVIPNDFAKV